MTLTTYDGTIKGRFEFFGATLGAAFADIVFPRVSKRLVSDDTRFSVVVLSDRFLPFSLCLWVCILFIRICVQVILFYIAVLYARF